MPQKRRKKQPSVWDAVQGRLWTAASREVLAPFAMGLAHDLNNVLTGVCSMSDLCLRDGGPGHPFRERLEIVRDHGQRAAELVQTLFREYQAQLGRREYHDLNRLVEAGLQLVRRTIPRSIQLESVLAPCALPVLLDEVAFRTVFLHLAINAAEATDGKGMLEVRTSRHERLPKFASLRGIRPSLPLVCLEIGDAGAGIDPVFHKLIWDPLFTTKAANRGAGLGLYLLRDFAEKSGGGISFSPHPKGGSRFALWIPEADLDSRRMDKSPHLVLGGDFGAQRAPLVKELGRRNWRVTAVARPDESVLGIVPEFDLLVTVLDRQPKGAHRLVSAIRRQRLPVRIIALTRNSSHLLGAKVDLVVSGKWSAKTLVGSIENCPGTSEGA